jgi:hypothetical protein
MLVDQVRQRKRFFASSGARDWTWKKRQDGSQYER